VRERRAGRIPTVPVKHVLPVTTSQSFSLSINDTFRSFYGVFVLSLRNDFLRSSHPRCLRIALFAADPLGFISLLNKVVKFAGDDTPFPLFVFKFQW